jgi:hypothetical protein
MDSYVKISYPSSWLNAGHIFNLLEERFKDILKVANAKKRKIFLDALYSNALDIYQLSVENSSKINKEYDEAKKAANPIKMALAFQKITYHQKTTNLTAKWMKIHRIRFRK